MPGFLTELFSSDGFMPHGHCYLWRADVLGLHLASDALTALAYISIPITLLHIVRRRRDVPFHWMFLCFGAFIIACGATHVMEIWTLWTPLYWLAGAIKAITGVASVATAILLIKLVPQALLLPTPTQLAKAHDELLLAHEALERRVAERTAELTRKNAELAKEIADRKGAEAEVRVLQQQHEADAVFRALLEAAPDAMVIVDTRGRIVFVNAETEKLFGHPAADLVGQPVNMLVPERLRADHTAFRTDYATIPAGRRIITGDDQLLGLRRDGSEFPADISLSPLDYAGGTLVFTAIRDVSERNRAEQALRSAVDTASAANAELEAFSYSVAHDLRTPLRAMSGFSTALLDDYGDQLDADGRRFLDRIVEGARQMTDMVDALLSLAKLTRIEPARQPVDLAQLGHTVIHQLRIADPARTVEFTAPDGMVVHGDPALLRLVLENLLGNAWKFTRNQPAARVELGRRDVGGAPAYFVRDNGAGFDMAQAGQLFAPFHRLHKQAEFDGTGIGLATVQRIVRRHGGRVWAESAQTHGATFSFTLPAAATAVTTGQLPLLVDPAGATAATQPPTPADAATTPAAPATADAKD